MLRPPNLRIPSVVALVSALGLLQIPSVTSELLRNIAQIQMTRVLVLSDRHRGVECGIGTDLTSTRAWLSHANVLIPTNARINYVWGMQVWLEGNCELALVYWQAGVKEGTPVSLWSSIALVRGLLHLQMYEAAVEIARQAKLESYYYQLGYSREIVGDIPDAIDFYSFALRVQPTYNTASRLAQLYIDQKDIQAEKALWTWLSTQAPRGGLLHHVATGRLAALNGDWDTLVHSTQRAAELTDDVNLKFDLYLRLGRALENGQQKERARVAFEQAMQIAPTASPEPYISLARFYANEKNYSQASEWLERAILLFPRDPWPYIHTGNLAVQLGDNERARYYYNLALQISPGHQGAIWALNSLK